MPRGVPRIPEPWEWVKTKDCRGPCRQEKPWALFAVRTLWPDGTVRTVDSYCKDCKYELSKDAQVAWRLRNRATYLAEQARRERRRYAAIVAQRRLANPGRGGTLMPVGPLLEFLAGAESDLPDVETMAQVAGVDERIIRRLRQEARSVSLAQADKIITRLGGRLDDVYPYEEAA